MDHFGHIGDHIADMAVLFMAGIHVFFFIKEFFGAQVLVENVFGLTGEPAQKTASVLKNAGFFNLVIAIGLPVSFYAKSFVATVFIFIVIILCGLIGKLTLPDKVGLPAFAAQSVIGGIALALTLIFWK